MLMPVQSAQVSNPDNVDVFKVTIAAINQRGGVGKNHNRLQGVFCDTRTDPNQEVSCAREMADQHVVATVYDLVVNNAAAVDGLMEAAKIPRIGLSANSTPDFSSSVAFPLSAGPVAGYVAAGVGFAKEGKKKVFLARTDASTGGLLKGFIAPPLKQAGVEVVGEVPLATGSTDYSPYVTDMQRSGADSVLMAVAEQAGAQFVATMAQLNNKTRVGVYSPTLSVDTLRKYKSVTKGTLLTNSYPYPSVNNEKRFPALKQYFAEMKASGKKNLQPNTIKPAGFNTWVALRAFEKVTAGLDTITNETVLDALKTAKDIDMDGLIPPWTPSAPGFSLFKTSSNHTVYVMKFDGKNVVTPKTPVDITQYFAS